MLFWKKRGESAAKKPVCSSAIAGSVVTPETVAPLKPATIALDFAAAAAADALTPFGRHAKSVEIAGGRLVLGGLKGAVSKEGLPVTPGATFRVDFTAEAIADPTVGANDFRIGAIFYDADGKVTRAWKAQSPILLSEGRRSGSIHVTVPPQAVRVHIGAFGPWTKEGDPGDGLVGISAVTLSATS